MQYKIKIQPSGVCFNSKDNLLNDALEQSVALEYSCKNGDCGICCAEVISGQVKNENNEIVSQGKILTCQSKPLTDLVLKANYFA